MSGVTLRGGPPVHPWVFSKRVYRADRGVKDGDLVSVATREGRVCGYGFYHSRSLIAVRMLSYDPDLVPDEDWLRARVRSAARLRREVLRLPDRTNAWRLVHAEGDGLSGLVVDEYAGVGSVALFSLGWQRRRDELERVLREEAGLEDVVMRADARTAEQEGLDVTPPAERPEVEVFEDGVRFFVDPAGGHKTGFFLDQRDNRRRIATLAAGKTLFDGMTYTGGFALAAACRGAEVVGMDLDEDAVAQAKRNAALNAVQADLRHGDVFDALRALVARPESERPEVLVVDPPKWARDRAGLGVALARYWDLNRLALQAVRPGGILATHSCSGLVPADRFREVVCGAAMDVRREARILHEGGAAPDHPVSHVAPESRYLKCLVVAVGPEGSGPGRGDREGHPARDERRPTDDRRPRSGGARRDGPRRGGPHGDRRRREGRQR